MKRLPQVIGVGGIGKWEQLIITLIRVGGKENEDRLGILIESQQLDLNKY